jgi:hypothetical protein
MTFSTDSHDYHVLEQGVELAPKDGIFLEIGVRAAGSLKMIIDKLLEQDKHVNVVGIDCWGNLPYVFQEDNIITCDYTNSMRDDAIIDLFTYTKGKNLNLTIMVLDDQEFFDRYEDGIPLYYADKKHIKNEYALVHFDGPHSLGTVMNEVQWFVEGDRILPGGILVFDDVGYYDHEQIMNYLEKAGYSIVTITEKKACYQKG